MDSTTLTSFISKSLIPFHLYHKYSWIFAMKCWHRMITDENALCFDLHNIPKLYTMQLLTLFPTNEVRIRFVPVNYTIVFKMVNLLTLITIWIFKKQLEETFSPCFVFGEKNCWVQVLESPTLYTVCWIAYFSIVHLHCFITDCAQSVLLNDWGENMCILVT